VFTQRPSAYLTALIAIALWSVLAYLGARLSSLPPLFLTGVALTIGGMLGLPRLSEWRVPLNTWCVGVTGILGYHLLLFLALRLAPPVEANLINYLWPLLIVLLSPLLLKGHALKIHHVAGAVAGLAGAALIVTGGWFRPEPFHLAGYACAGGAALTWSSYSVMTKRLPHFSTAAVGGFCMVSGVLALLLYVVTQGSETHVVPTGVEWLLLAVLGLGPMGGAFYAWDRALKHGDPRIIGALAYLTPLMSTGVLVLIGGREFTSVSLIAVVLIVGGALVGSRDLFSARKPAESHEHASGETR
jgi:drug/metabolite transporter (DMT)-like permease